MKEEKVLAIHEASGQDVTFQDDVAFALVSGGGKPGQGYPCVLIIYEGTANTDGETVLRMA